MCIFSGLPLLSEQPLEGDDGSQQALGGGQQAATLILTQPQGCFFLGIHWGCLERWVLARPQRSSSQKRLKAAIVGGKAPGKKAASRDPHPFTNQAAGWDIFGVEFHRGSLEGAGVGNEITFPSGPPTPGPLSPLHRYSTAAAEKLGCSSKDKHWNAFYDPEISLLDVYAKTLKAGSQRG